MEILNNFSSIYCYISFVIGAVLMLVALAIAAMGKVKEPRNKVRFYVTADAIRHPTWMKLWMGKPVWDNKYLMWTRPSNHVFFLDDCFAFHEFYNINLADFKDMKPKEIREVFLNLED